MSDAIVLKGVTKTFGPKVAVKDLDLVVPRGGLYGFIGPNGAGKTTVFNCLTGFYRPTEGRLTLYHQGKKRYLERMEGFRIARAGVARTFQNIRLFSQMTVLENLVVAQHNRLMLASYYTIGGLLGLSHYRKAEKEAVEYARHWLDRIHLTDKADWEASNLPYGDQRRLEIARAMCTRPAVLCLDEPAAGLNPRESADLNKLLVTIRDEEEIGLLLIEHDMNVVMEISDHIVVLDYGSRIAAGTPAEIRSDPAVIRAYLGEEESEELPPEVKADLQPDQPRE